MKIYFVTSNKGKWKEFQELMNEYEIEMLNVKYPEIQADSLQEVALYGLQYLVKKIDGMFMIEDSGLFIHALNGFPGVYSSYIFKSIGNDGILKLMEGIKERKASFHSLIALYDGGMHFFEGICSGKISYKQRGKEGFGYDPIFIPEGCKKTFAEMETKEKNEYSHRGKAIRKLKEYLEISNK
ncbi:MAG: XTP/dITP diphosphatase [Thermoplasmata archaeon]|nr:MAG: XTP/dITP diphosphatase [Thermoplasmata archaeon]